MKVWISPSELKGHVIAPAGKSEAQRIVATSLLCEGPTFITRYPDNDDALAALSCAQAFGAEVKDFANVLMIEGNPGEILRKLPEKVLLDCEESGLTARLFSSIAALYSSIFEVTGGNSLSARPFDSFKEVFDQLGVGFSSNLGLLPLTIKGPIVPADVTVDGSVSSQFLSGLLIAFSALPDRRKIVVRQLSSVPYAMLTLDILKRFGVQWTFDNKGVFEKESGTLRATRIMVPGDWSSAATLLVAGSLCAVGGIEVAGIDLNSVHADKNIINLLDVAGIETHQTTDGLAVKKSTPAAFEFDFGDCPDLVPIAIVLAASSKGECTLKNTARLRYKESDRGMVMQHQLCRAGIEVMLFENCIKVKPTTPNFAHFSACGDHRIAMALSLFSMAHKGGSVDGAECIGKSYRDFFKDLIQLGGLISE
jgi:3-phosphoshikimate 1-carboxyvinyltransferase